jgi:hypothetical protein
LDPKQEDKLIDFLRHNKGVFAWRPTDMLGVSREVVEHTLDNNPGSKPVKQGMHRFNEEKHKAIGGELVKLIIVGFIKEV